MANNIDVRDANDVVVTVITTDTGSGVQLYNHAIADAVTPSRKATVSSGGALKVDPSAVTQPVSAASLPLPSGAATAAKQPALGTAGTASADVLSVQGIASGTALGVSMADGGNATFGAEADGASAGDTTTTTFMALFKRLLQRITTLLAVFPTTIDTNSGNKSASTLRVAIATDQPALTNKLLVTPDLPSGASTAAKQPALGTAGTASADVLSVQGVASMTALLVTAAGGVAHDGADSGNPVKVGARARSSEIAAVSSDDRSDLITDLVGKLITLPYANPEQFENGTTAAITDTTSTAVLAAAGAGVRHYVTSVIVTNSHATVGTFVKILDGSTIIWEGYAAAAGGGFCLSFPVPLRGTANTAINAQAVTTGANFIVSCCGYKGA